MTETEKKMQHAMQSFALLGGLLATDRNRPNPGRDHKPRDFVTNVRRPR